MTSSVMSSGTEEEEEGPATTAMHRGQTCGREKCVRKGFVCECDRAREGVDAGASVCRRDVKSKQTQEENRERVRNKIKNHRVSAEKTCR